MQNDNKPCILLISSANPCKGPGTGAINMYNAFKDFNYEIDLLTLYQVPNRPDIKYIYKRKSKIRDIISRIKKKLSRYPIGNYCFFYKKEKYPPIPSNKVLRKITKSYDIVLIYFWQELLSFQTIDKIYDKLKCQFVFCCADYSPMSGGCHFTGDCTNYQSGCGCCPAFNSTNPNDFTHWNIQYREKIYEKVQPIILGNTYMIESFFKKSYLLKNLNLKKISNIINHNIFKPLEPKILYKQFKISPNKTNIIAFGCQSLTDKRKGMDYLLNALDIVYDNMTLEERDKTILLFAGKNGNKITPRLKFDYKDLGFINPEALPAFYSISSLFLCSSIDDAGPSMLAQSIACGTPLVSFKMGAALDLLLNQDTGYCAELCNTEDLAHGVLQILRMPPIEYKKLRTNCTNVSQKINSKEAFVNTIINEFINKKQL